MSPETKSGGTFANDATVGGVDWQLLSNAAASDDAYAEAFLFSEISHYHKSTNYGFGIPVGAIIDGIEFKLERKKDAGGGGMKDNSIKLVKGGAIGGDDKADLATEWTTSDLIITYGGPTDKWGRTWTVADINASNFGIVVSVISSGDLNAFLDHTPIKVYYTEIVNEEGASTIIN